MELNSWRAPYSGLAYFFVHPSLWGWAFIGTAISGTMAAFLFIKVIQWTYPATNTAWSYYFWHALQSFGWGFLSLILMIAIVFPLILNACFAKGFCSLLKRAGIEHREEGITTAFLSSFWVFFRTLKWRIVWPLLLIATIFFLPPLIFPLSLLAVNHLAVIESVDLVLSLFGMKANDRVRWLRKRGTECFAFAISGATLSFLLGLTGVGWIFWIPSIYCGAFVWVQSAIQKEEPKNG